MLDINIKSPDSDAISTVFRAAHSIKGGAGRFGFTDLTELTSKAENQLDRVRNSEIVMTPQIVDTLLVAWGAPGAIPATLRCQAELARHREGFCAAAH